ncbi:hypothetical protein DPEC_G00332440 [Dallia pectoralis]|uniref:Uncharacterized protein n=1 Tax=Dallia pectoralis TaxID=75939 RepID=A0ACC2F654_DALPE|nr:hypothetical protein DPEC_G00332440 [Dallia pectoralis]
MDSDGVGTMESISTPFSTPVPSPNSQGPEPCYSPSSGLCTSPRFIEPIHANLKTQTETSSVDPDPLVFIQTPHDPVLPHSQCPSHSVGVGVRFNLIEPDLCHPNVPAYTTDPDPHVLIQTSQDFVFPFVEGVRNIDNKCDSVEDHVIDHPFNTHVLTDQGQDPESGLQEQLSQISGRKELEAALCFEAYETESPGDAYWALSKSRTRREQGTGGVSLKPPEEQNDSPNELWLDACQYHTLAVEEEEEGAISVRDEQSCHTVRRRSVTEWLDDTKGPGFLLEAEAPIGQGNGDSVRWLSIAPVERSGSTDSWYSALSDWTVKVTEGGLRPEDFTGTAALTKAQELEQAYPQTLMAIQDQAVKPKTSPKTPNLPLELVSVGNLQDRIGQEEGSKGEELFGECIPEAEQWDTESERGLVITGDDCPSKPRDNHSTLGSSSDTLASPTTTLLGLEIKMPEAVPAHSCLPFSSALSDDIATQAAPLGKDLFELRKDIDITHKKDSYLHGDCVDRLQCQNSTPKPQMSKLVKDGVQKVTEDNAWEPGDLFIKEEVEENRSSDKSAESWSLGRKTNITGPQEVSFLSKELSNCIIVTNDHLMISEKECIAYVTLDQKAPLDTRTSLLKQMELDKNKQANNPITRDLKKLSKMPSKTRTHSKKEKSTGGYPQAPLGSKPQENLPLECHIKCNSAIEDGDNGTAAIIETVPSAKAHGKKKKHSGKHSQTAAAKGEEAGVQPPVGLDNGAKPKTATRGKIDIFESKFGSNAGKTKDKPTPAFSCKQDNVHSESKQKQPPMKDGATGVNNATPSGVVSKGLLSTIPFSQKFNDNVIKQSLLSTDKLGKQELEATIETTRKKAYSEVLKQRTQHAPKEGPRVVQPIQAVSVIDDPQSLDLWCQFTAVFTDYTVTWTREGVVLAEIKRSAGDESRVSFTITKASNKDLGKYDCSLICSLGSVNLDYLLTYDVLSEIVIPATPHKITKASAAEVVGEEEAVKCCCLLFKEDFLSDQYFGENQQASLVTEKDHFGEGMHRKAFRTRLQAGMVTVFTQDHPCVLKVHSAICHGTKNNEEVVQKNYNLAVEECHVQNTAREYIKAWTAVAQTQDAFGEVPEIIPIYLVHRPSNDIPYATLEEELMGEFVKYSVRDGKEINLKRRDSEAGQKCCAFQHWVYENTEGNLLVTDMQGVGMRLTDVGIATCKKGYKGFKGNCATSFIDQFKALHLCNKYCEILGLNSLQPKPKKAVGPKTKLTQPAMKKKASGLTLKSKS